MKKVLLILFFPFLLNSASAQTIKGKLVDQNGKGLSGMQLELFASSQKYSSTSSSDGSFIFAVFTGISKNQLPGNYIISDNYPNPFNPKTRINFILPKTSNLKIELYNVLGQKINDVIEKQFSAGSNFVDIELSGFPNGVYFARINIDDKCVAVKKLMLIYGSQHLNTAPSPQSVKLAKMQVTRLDSIVVTGQSINRTVLKDLPVLSEEVLDLGSFTIFKMMLWEVVSTTSSGMSSIYFLDSENGWAVGSNDAIFHTNDGGRTWIKQVSGTNCSLQSVLFIDSLTGFAAGSTNALLYTTDSGNSWNNRNIQCDSSTIFSSINQDNSGNIYFISNYGDIFYSSDSGSTWITRYNFRQYGFSYVFFHDTANGFANQTGLRMLRKSTDGGNTWNQHILPAGQFIGDVNFIDERYGWFTESWLLSSSMHDSSSIYFTSDGGNSWHYKSSLHALHLDKIHFLDPDTGWITSMVPGFKIYHTTDGGQSWVCQFNNEDYGDIRDFYFYNSKLGWAITSKGYVLKYNVE